MRRVVYDAAVLVAADKNERRVWAEHKVRLELGAIPLVPAPVVAQVSRSPQQAQIRRFLTGCSIVPLGESEAHEAGRLLGMTRMADVVDAVLVTVALRHKAVILTSAQARRRRRRGRRCLRLGENDPQALCQLNPATLSHDIATAIAAAIATL